MFGSIQYRWTFYNSQFFAVMTVTSFIVLVVTIGLAVACRLNFGKGLREYCEWLGTLVVRASLTGAHIFFVIGQ